MRPIDPVTLDEAAWILGVARSTVQIMVLDGRLEAHGKSGQRRLSQADVEALAMETYDWWGHRDELDSYWVTCRRAAQILGVCHQRVSQLADKDRIPFVRHASGRRLFRRAQMEVMSRL
jgi:excisionase family DNA binding protein